jgi:hypothetical protein
MAGKKKKKNCRRRIEMRSCEKEEARDKKSRKERKKIEEKKRQREN